MYICVCAKGSTITLAHRPSSFLKLFRKCQLIYTIYNREYQYKIWSVSDISLYGHTDSNFEQIGSISEVWLCPLGPHPHTLPM